MRSFYAIPCHATSYHPCSLLSTVACYVALPGRSRQSDSHSLDRRYPKEQVLEKGKTFLAPQVTEGNKYPSLITVWISPFLVSLPPLRDK